MTTTNKTTPIRRDTSYSVPTMISNHWRHWCTLLFALMMVLGVVGGVRGQEVHARRHHIYIRIYNNTFLPQYDKFAELVVAGAQINLLKYKIYFQQVETGQMLAITFFDTDDLSLSIYSSPVSDIFPFLDQFSARSSRVGIIPNNLLKTYANAVQLTTAISLYQSGLCDEANPIFEDFIGQLNPNRGENFSIDSTLSSIYFYQANCAIVKHDFESAIPLLESSLDLFLGPYREITTGALRITYYLAWVYLQLDREQDAILLLENMTEEARRIPGSGDDYNDALINSAQIYALASHFEKAIENLNIANDRFKGKLADIRLLRGQMYLALYEWDKALADYNAALELAPDYADAYFYRGVLYASILQTGLDKRDEALADFRRYLDLAPDGDHAKEASQAIADLEAAQDALNE